MSGINALFSTALSGLNAATAILNTSASNIANAGTPGYPSRRVGLTESASGGVSVGPTTRDSSSGGIDEDGAERSNVDLPTELVQLRQGQILYQANAAVVRAGDEMLGTLLDIFDDGRRHR